MEVTKLNWVEQSFCFFVTCDGNMFRKIRNGKLCARFLELSFRLSWRWPCVQMCVRLEKKCENFFLFYRILNLKAKIEHKSLNWAFYFKVLIELLRYWAFELKVNRKFELKSSISQKLSISNISFRMSFQMILLDNDTMSCLPFIRLDDFCLHKIRYSIKQWLSKL